MCSCVVARFKGLVVVSRRPKTSRVMVVMVPLGLVILAPISEAAR